MREIKFRAYIKKDYNKELIGKMLEVSSIHLKRKKVIIGYSLSNTHYGNRSYLYDDIELMQFTGLKDKNGKEIYEGDILKTKYNKRDFIVWIKYDEEYAQFVTRCAEFILDEEPLGDLYESRMEVIGNVYENPELLKGANNIE